MTYSNLKTLPVHLQNLNLNAGGQRSRALYTYKISSTTDQEIMGCGTEYKINSIEYSASEISTECGAKGTTHILY